MSRLINAGRLISTTDMKLAARLQELVDIEDITGGAQPREIQQSDESISFMHRGEFYELAAI